MTLRIRGRPLFDAAGGIYGLIPVMNLQSLELSLPLKGINGHKKEKTPASNDIL